MLVMEENQSPGRTRRRFTKEFKSDAVSLVIGLFGFKGGVGPR